MTRTLLTVGLLACLAAPASAETYSGSGSIDGYLSGTFKFQDGATSEITTYTFSYAPVTANFSFEYETSINFLLGGILYMTGVPSPAFFGGGQYPPFSGGGQITDSAPGEGPDKVSIGFPEQAPGPAASDGYFQFDLFDPSGTYFETGSLTGVLFTASGDKMGGYGDGTGSAYNYSFTFTTVPEPSSLVLCGIAAATLGVLTRRRSG